MTIPRRQWMRRNRKLIADPVAFDRTRDAGLRVCKTKATQEDPPLVDDAIGSQGNHHVIKHVCG